MLTTIYLNHQPRFEADKISNERSDRHLSAEFELGKSPIAQRKPQLTLSVGHS